MISLKPNSSLRSADIQNHTVQKTTTIKRYDDAIDCFIQNSSVADSAIEHYHLPWITENDGTQFSYRATPLIINAPIARVWEVVKQANQYGSMSDNAIIATVDGAVEPGKAISFQVARDTWRGYFIPESHEHIHVVDEERKIIGWRRSLPLSGYSERYHLLVPIDDQHTLSYIALKVPGIVGFFTQILGSTLLDSFNKLHQGIARRSALTEIQCVG